jgi:hypothetical protein
LFHIANGLRILPRLFEKGAHNFFESLSGGDQLFNDFPCIIPINLDALCRRRREDATISMPADRSMKCATVVAGIAASGFALKPLMGVQ